METFEILIKTQQRDCGIHALEINFDRLAFAMTIAAGDFGVFATTKAVTPSLLKQLASCQVEG